MALCALCWSAPSWAGSFDARGVFVPDPQALVSESFEDAAALTARGVVLWNPATDRAVTSGLDATVVVDPTALHGGGELFLDSSLVAHVGIRMPVTLLPGRVEVRAWVKAAPGGARLSALYVLDAAHPTGPVFSAVTGVETGRRTSDGWVELSTGPLEVMVLGATLSSVAIANPDEGVVVDAVEVLPLGPSVIPADTDCSLGTEAATCGVAGSCLFGRCVDSAAVFGPVPFTRSHRRDYLARVAFGLRHLHGNRSAAARMDAVQSQLDALVDTTSPRDFWQGINAALVLFRDGHTWPRTQVSDDLNSTPSLLRMETSGATGVCLGLTELDLMGGGPGYSVFSTNGGLLGADVRVGDVLWKVDGEPLDVWLPRTASIGGQLRTPSDARALPAWDAVQLPALLATRAGELTFRRCASATDCATPTEVHVDVASRMRTAITQAGNVWALPDRMCDGRFQPATLANRAGGSGSYPVTREIQDGISMVQFDGVYFDNAANNALSTSMATTQSMVLVDTRLGNGGSTDSMQFVFGLLRDTREPLVAFDAPRPWQAADVTLSWESTVDLCFQAPVLANWDGCTGTYSMVATGTSAPAANARVAWLNGADISANDFLPRTVVGRSQLRIFGPVPSAGAFGSVVNTQPMLPGESSGITVQNTDTRLGTTRAEMVTAPWASGTGVVPDETVVQKLSDSLMQVDTTLARAKAWLKETP
jgi:hypothetical protein